MKSIKETVSSFAIRQALNYARKDPDKNLMNLLNLFEKADIKKVNRVTYENLHKVLDDPNNNWTRFIKRILFDVDSGVLDKFVPVFNEHCAQQLLAAHRRRLKNTSLQISPWQS